MGVKLAMRRYAPGNSTPVVTDYAGSFVYENGQPLFFGSPEGRVVKNGNNFEYQYAIADHQGNTRVVFTSAVPSVETPMTDFESDPGDLENYPSGGSVSALPLFNRTPGGTHSELLNGGYSSQIGVAKSFKVYPGDKVKIQAYAKYEDVAGPGNGQAFATALLQAFSLPAPAAGETGTPSSALDTWGGLVSDGIQDDDAAPQAFVNIVVFDKNFDFLDATWTQIDVSAKQVGTSPDVPHDELAREYNIDEEGYVFMYVSNNSPVNVYFDDVTFTYTPTNIIQYNEYYPFGLQTSNSWTRDNNRNDYLYNAGSELNAASGWYETFFRGYDPALGRFLQVDPLATKFASQTPYNYAVNNPVMLNDPSGGDALPDGTPDWVEYRMEMINRYMKGGGGVIEAMRRKSHQRWKDHEKRSEGVSISPEYFRVIANTFNSQGKLFIGQNSWSYIYLDVGAKVQIDQDGDPIEGTEFGANIFHFDEIDLAIGRSLGAQQGNMTDCTNSNWALEVAGGVFGAMEGFTASQGHWLGKNGKYYPERWGGNQYTGSRAGAFKAANTYKLAGRATIFISAGIGVYSTIEGYQADGGQFGYNAQMAAVSSAGSIAGGIAGAKGGALVGAAIGAWFGGIGAVPGAVIGGIIGGIGGSLAGGYAGETAVNYYHGR